MFLLLPRTLRDSDEETTENPTNRKPCWDHIPNCQKRMKEDKWPWLQEKAALSNGQGCAWSIVSDQQIPHKHARMCTRTQTGGGAGGQ